MSKADRDKWDRRYAEDSYRRHDRVSLVCEWLAHIPPGKALDLACGTGRNAMFLAEAGFRVDAIDISPVGLELARREAQSRGLEINWIQHDLDEPYPFADDYGLIAVMWFVRLDLLRELCAHLAPGGLLVSEQHLVAEGDLAGPENPRFRVAPGALRAAVEGLEILFYEEGSGLNSDGELMATARVVACRPG